MEIIIGKTAGFCYGVENAVTKTIQEVKQSKKEDKIYCLGEIVHNKQVVEEMENIGVKKIENVKEIEKENKDSKVKVVIRAHGIPPQVYQEIQENGFEQVDLTCPNVLAIHKLAQISSEENEYIFLIGKKDHPETIGTFGFCKNGSKIEAKEDIQNAIEELKKSNLKKILVLVQTTFSIEKFNQIVDEIKENIDKINKENKGENKITLNIRNTICNATRIRQEETENISKQVQYMIIVGGRNSSNTKKLYEIAQANCENSVCIETKDELDIEKIKEMIATNKNKEFRIGIMAGASTPKVSIIEIKDALSKILSIK